MSSVFDHPWQSGLFGDAELAALWSAEAQMRHMLRFEAAWSRAMGAAGLIDPARAEELAKAITAFQPDMADLAQGMGRDGVPVPALVAQLKAAFGDEGIHKGATSQDVVDTGVILTVLETFKVLEGRLTGLAKAIDTLDAEEGDNPLMGRTRMQAATMIKVSDRLATWRAPLDHHQQRLQQMIPRIAQVQIGGASGDRAGLAPALIKSMEASLGLPAGDKATHAMRDGIGEFASTLALITGTLGKIGQDVCLMAQQGVEEIALANTGASSAMPHKQNPVIAELLVTLARFNATQVSGIQHAMIHEQERSGSAWGLEWMILPQMALSTGRSLVAGQALISSITRIGTV